MLRIHASKQGLARARHEFQVQRHLTRLNYPAPPILLLEESCRRFGGPFLIMEQIPGPTMLDAMLQKPWRPLHFPGLMAEYQARLHALSPDDFPVAPGSFLSRQFEQLSTIIAENDLAGLSPGLEWLRTHQPSEPAVKSILHLDFHPLNLIERLDGSLAVLDWTYADCGDPHADVATTLVIQECIPVESASVWDRLSVFVGRPLVTSWYLHTYKQSRPLDDGRLAYYRAWAALRALTRYAHCACAGPEASDTKPALVAHLAPNLMKALGAYFERWSGVTVKL
jgi:aminoglycoside phosphotransferase (APT) family kinase protein